MMIEADAMIRDQGTKAIQEMGYQVYAVPCRTLAERTTNAIGSDIDLVVLDLSNAVSNGQRLLSRFGNSKGRPRILLTSGFCEFPPASSLLRELGFDFIQKPFTPAELADKVKSILF
jgi:DNA-binding response OmpR family regulator